jgi:crotonobetainyl-CoA:carnitine CoA-transferase CaiB-like acyl-CoA transferase
MLLGDMGAEVIKIEPPGEGDPLRGQGFIKNGLSWYYACCNRNKKSLTLDLYSKEGKEILASLIKTSDVVVDNFRPGVMEKMGFGYEQLKALRPDIVYCGITGFGVSGPYRDRPAFDFIIQAMSGLMSVNGREGEEPLRVAPPISDLVTGLYAAFGIAAALFNRARTGQGQQIQTALLDGLISFFAFMTSNFLASGKLPVRTGNDHAIVSPYGTFRASDGDLAMAPSNDKVYEKLLNALELTDLKDHPDFATNDLRMANRAKINAIVQEKIGAHDRAYWVEHLNKAGVPCSPIMNLREVFEDPQVRHQQMVLDVEHPGHGTVQLMGFPLKFGTTPCQVRRPAPALGEHNEEILGTLGLDDEAIAGLKSRGVI